MGVIIPIASKVNPAASQMLPVATDWPPREHRARLDRYAQHRKIFLGEHELVLDERHLAQDYDVFIACNLPSLIVKIPADLLAGEPFNIDYDEDTPDEAQERVQGIWDRSDLQTLAYEHVLDTGALGDGVLVVERNEDGEAIVKSIPASTWFPEHHPDDVRKIIGHKQCWVLTMQDGSKERHYLRVVEYLRGENVHRMFEIKGSAESGKIGVEQPHGNDVWAHFYGDNIPDDHQEGVEGEFLLVHVPNFRTAREYFGQSDYMGMEPMFGALDSRLTQVDQILHRHSDPSLNVPAGAFEKIKDALRDAGPEALRLLRMDEDGNTANYLTWDGKLGDNYTMIDQLVDKILMVGEIDPYLVGKGEAGAMSGVALRTRLIRTLAKVGRKWRYLKPALEKALELAQQLEGAEPVGVDLQKSDGLPLDTLEAVQIASAKVEAGFSSRKREGMRLEDVDEAGWDEIDSEIADDEKASTRAVGEGLQRTPVQVSVNAEDFDA